MLISATLTLVDLLVAVMKMSVSVAIVQLEVSAALMQVKSSAANMWVTVFLKLCTWESLLQSCKWYFLQCIKHMTISVLIMQVPVSIVAMHVTASSSNFIFLSLTYIPPFFIKLTRKLIKALYISGLHFTTSTNILPKLRYFVGRIYIQIG